jgi:hypothetical protein
VELRAPKDRLAMDHRGRRVALNDFPPARPTHARLGISRKI